MQPSHHLFLAPFWLKCLSHFKSQKTLNNIGIFFFFKNVVGVIEVLFSSSGHHVKMDFAQPTNLTDQVPPAMAEVAILFFLWSMLNKGTLQTETNIANLYILTTLWDKSLI